MFSIAQFVAGQELLNVFITGANQRTSYSNVLTAELSMITTVRITGKKQANTGLARS